MNHPRQPGDRRPRSPRRSLATLYGKHRDVLQADTAPARKGRTQAARASALRNVSTTAR